MERDQAPSLDALAAALARARPAGFRDLFLERVADTVCHIERGNIVARHAILREGGAVRREGTHYSADGLTRVTLARLLDVPGRTLPTLGTPPHPVPPDLAPLVAELPETCESVRWRWRWAAVVRGGRAVTLRRPQLLEVTLVNGRRSLATFPRPLGWRPPEALPPGRASAPVGPARALLAPAAAAVLLHELLGHTLEGDFLVSGTSPLARLWGKRLLALPLDVIDDPTRFDLPGAFDTDDEGYPGQPRPLLAAGTLIGALCDEASAATLGVQPGNARRAGVHAPPRPRLSNLIVTNAWPEDPPREGATIEVESVSAGSLDPLSELLELGVRSGWRLQRGRRASRLHPFTLVGRVDRVRAGLLGAFGTPQESGEPGWCGKAGEVVPAGAVAPWLLVEGMEVR